MSSPGMRDAGTAVDGMTGAGMINVAAADGTIVGMIAEMTAVMTAGIRETTIVGMIGETTEVDTTTDEITRKTTILITARATLPEDHVTLLDHVMMSIKARTGPHLGRGRGQKSEEISGKKVKTIQIRKVNTLKKLKWILMTSPHFQPRYQNLSRQLNLKIHPSEYHPKFRSSRNCQVLHNLQLVYHFLLVCHLLFLTLHTECLAILLLIPEMLEVSPDLLDLYPCSSLERNHLNYPVLKGQNKPDPTSCQDYQI